MIFVERPAPLCFARRIGAVAGEFVVYQRLRPGDPFACHDAIRAARADAMLHARYLTRMPAVEKITYNAAVTTQLSIVVRRPLPDAHRRQMGRPECADIPLVHRIIRNAVDADLAIAPGLCARPFNALVKVLRFPR